MKSTVIAKANRNTAVATTSLVSIPCLSLLRDEVSEGACIWSFDPSLPENEAKVWAVDLPGSREWIQHVAEPFNLVDWCVKRIVMENEETGDEVPALRVVLMGTDGDTMSFVSVGVAASLDLIRTLRGDGPYDPPIPIVVVPVKTRHGYNTLKLRPVAQPVEKQVKSK